MAYQGRFIAPLHYASVVILHKRCGKKNCRCYTKDQRHEAYGLKYRAYNEDGSITQHVKHLPKEEVSTVARSIAIRKAMYMWHHLSDELQSLIVKKYGGKDNDTFFIGTYVEAKHPKYLTVNSRKGDVKECGSRGRLW